MFFGHKITISPTLTTYCHMKTEQAVVCCKPLCTWSQLLWFYYHLDCTLTVIRFIFKVKDILFLSLYVGLLSSIVVWK